MEIKYKYPSLSNFLLAYISESDVEGFSNDHDVAEDFASTESSLSCSNLVEESKAILSETQFPWQEICQASNRRFENAEIVKEWLQELIHIIETPTEK
jgi:hypothetical protein